MQSDGPSTNGQPDDGALPPVEPPSARFILQLFLVPLLLVGVFGATVYFLFGWLGVGTSDPRRLLDDLESSTSEKVRWMAAQDLAQILPRNEALRNDVGFALRVAELLRREMRQPPPPADDAEQKDFLKFLPAAVANFHVPVGAPLLLEIVNANVDRLDDEGHRLRLYNALAAFGTLQGKLQEFDRLPAERREQLLADLQAEATDGTERARLAKNASEYLQARQEHSAERLPQLSDSLRIVPTLAKAVRCEDEMARKYAILALANCREAGAEALLRELTGPNDDLTRLEDHDAARARRQIRQNAALALARRGSPLTPWHIVLETLDEDTLRGSTYVANAEMATATLLKALRDLKMLKADHADVYQQQTDIQDAIAKLGNSPTAIVEIEARRLLGGAPPTAEKRAAVSRESLLIGTFGAAVVLLLALAVIARWKRRAAPVA